MASIDIIMVLDASGSMYDLRGDTVGAFNKFIADQRKQPGEAYVTLATFDNTFVQRYQAKPLHDVPPLDEDGYMGGHGNSTALLDAVGKEIVPRDQLREREWLAEVVVGARLKSHNAIVYGTLCAEHNDWCRDLVCAKPPDDLDAIAPGKHPIDYGRVVPGAPSEREAVVAVLHPVDAMPFLLEAPREEGPDFLVVFD